MPTSRPTSHGVSAEVLLRDATRSARRWQTYAIRAGFTALLLTGVLFALQGAIAATRSGLWDVADLGWLGRGLFFAFTVSQVLLATLLAPLMTAAAVAEETEERTLELLVLTRLTPGRILGGLVLARLLVLLAIVAGALPVMTLVVSLGGVSAMEVVSVTVHTLTTVVLLGMFGAFFALFTRSPMLATLASAAYVLPAFWLLPTAYAVLTGAPWDAVRFSTLLGPMARDWSALLTPLSFLPAFLLTARLGTRLFELRVAGADIRHAFAGETWQVRRWLVSLGVLFASAVVILPICVPLSYVDAHGSGLPAIVSIPADLTLWGWFVGVVHVGTWAYLRVGIDVVDALDRLVGRRRRRGNRSRLSVWWNPVAWREARPRAWGATAVPIFVTWAVVLVVVLQSMWWLVPGGILAVGILNGVGALVLGVWLATHSIEAERRAGTLQVLLTTPLSAGGIVAGKLVGIGIASLPMLALALPLLALGVPHAHLISALSGGDVAYGDLFLRGAAAWAWLVAVWLAAALAGMIVAMRVGKPRTAFGITLGGLAAVLAVPTLVGRLVPELTAVALPARLVAAPLAGGGSWPVLGLGILAVIGLAALLGSILVGRLRRWGAAAAVLLALALSGGAEAADVVEDDDLAILVEPVGDGWMRPGTWTALRVRVANLGRSTTGELVLTERDADSHEELVWRRPVDLPEGARKDLLLRFRVGIHGRPRNVTLTTADARDVSAEVLLSAVGRDDVLLGVLGDDHLGLTGLADAWSGPVPRRAARFDARDVRTVRTGVVPLALAPDHAADWSAFDWIVWPAADPTRLDADQLSAALHAVADGAHLVVTVTDTWRQVAESPLAEALPVRLSGVEVVELDPVGPFGLPPVDPRATPVAGAEIRDVAGRAAWILARDPDGRPLWVAGTYGLGTVHVLLVQPTTPGLDRTPTFWRRLLFLPGTDGLPEVAEPLAVHAAEGAPSLHDALRLHDGSLMACPIVRDTGDYGPSAAESWEEEIRGWLSDIPGVAPIPMSWLVAFALVYLGVIGPLDYLVLRRLRREPLTWVTFPVAIAIFSVVALVGTTWNKGSQAVLTRIEIVDWLPGTDLWRGDGWLGVFATRKTRLGLANGFDDAVLAPQAVSGFMTSPTVEVGAGPTHLAYRAETWTLAYSRSSWVEPLGGGLTLDRAGAPGSAGTLRGTLPVPLSRAWLVRKGELGGREWYPLGPLDGPVEISLDPSRWTSSIDVDEEAMLLQNTLLDAVEDGRGHLHVDHHTPTLLGIATRAVEPIGLTGLAPVEQSLTVLRVPLAPASSGWSPP